MGAPRAEGFSLPVPALRGLGLNTLVITYRNDPDAPPNPGCFLTPLSSEEWHDQDAAARYAEEHGGRQLTLIGYRARSRGARPLGIAAAHAGVPGSLDRAKRGDD